MVKIGLIKNEYGWKRILEQEKTPWEIANLAKINEYPFLILNSTKTSNTEKKQIKNYIKDGGIILTDLSSLNTIYKSKKISKVYIKSIKENNNLFKNIQKINIENYGYKLKNKEVKIHKFKIGKGLIIALPFNLNSLMKDSRSKRQYLPSPHSALKENISIVSKGDLRRLIINCFHYIYSIKKTPYVHLWYYPNNYNSVFTYRIDLDIFNKNEINNIINVIKNNNKIKLNWFISVINSKNHEKGILKLHNLNQDIQSHSYKHLVFNSLKENYKNILESNRFISKFKEKPIGFAAPFGHWNEPLNEALKKLNYKYSSEFSLSYDDLPFYPSSKNNKSKILQLPIYPTCVGLLEMQLYTKNKMKSYFDYLIDMQYRKQMPLFLYDHPNNGIGKHPKILEHILKKIKSLNNVLITDYLQFYNWWEKREKIKYSISLSKNNLKIITNNKDKDIYIRIILPNNKEARIILENKTIKLKEIKIKEIPIFKDNKITNINILKSKLLFSVYYLKILIKALKRKFLSKIL
ncbi:hypothetical protein CL617_03655 [archaeon]|nr:hypothetical protein [archaeon]|tara:strand:+ start:1813 stop:3375 length:1563 start_codon:yes stop_codon:yes gene_type:complete